MRQCAMRRRGPFEHCADTGESREAVTRRRVAAMDRRERDKSGLQPRGKMGVTASAMKSRTTFACVVTRLHTSACRAQTGQSLREQSPARTTSGQASRLRSSSPGRGRRIRISGYISAQPRCQTSRGGTCRVSVTGLQLWRNNIVRLRERMLGRWRVGGSGRILRAVIRPRVAQASCTTVPSRAYFHRSVQ